MIETNCGRARIDELLRDVARWRLMELYFEAPDGTWRENVQEIAREAGDPRLQEIAELALRDAAPDLYHSLFGPGGPAGPRAITYDRSVQPGQRLAELASYYQAFAYSPQIAEPLDHVAVQIGFVAYLRLKEAYALACDDTEQAARVADAARSFIANHLAYVARPLAQRLAPCEIPYLTQAAVLLLETVDKECPEISCNTDNVPFTAEDDPEAWSCSTVG